MYWNSIVSKLCYSTVSVKSSDNPKQDYVQTMILPSSTKMQELSEEILYFCSIADYAKLDASAKKCGFVLCADKSRITEPVYESNVIVFQYIREFYDFYEKIIREISQLEEKRRSVSELFFQAAQNSSLQELANEIDRIFKTSVSILDNSFAPIVYSENTPVASAVIRQDMHTASLPLAWSKTLYSAAEASGGRQVQRFDQNLNDGFHLRNYFTTIYMNRIKIGSFSLLFIRPQEEALPELAPELLALLPRIAHVLSLRLGQAGADAAYSHSYYTYLFANFLRDPDPSRIGEFLQRLSVAGYEAKEVNYMVQIDFTEDIMPHSGQESFAKQIQHILSGSIYFFYQEGIFFLCGYDSEENDLAEKLRIVQENLRRTNFRIGVSSAFYSFRELEIAISECRSAIRIGNRLLPSGKVFYYDELRLADCADACTRISDWQKLCYPPYLRLLEYDKTHDSHLIETLCLYLQKGKRTAEICELLHIHKNTLYYRLRIIKDIMNVDFEAPEIIAQIWFTEKLLEMQK